MFLFGLRDLSLIKFVLKIILLYMVCLFFVFSFGPLLFFITATLLTIASAYVITMKIVKRYPVIEFGRPTDRAYAFPKNLLQRKVSYFYAITMTIVFFMALITLSIQPYAHIEYDILSIAVLLLVFGYPGVVNLFLLLHPISYIEETGNGR